MPSEISRETLSVADRNEILRKLTPCFEERVNAIKAFMETPTHSTQQVMLVQDAVAEMKDILFDPDIVEGMIRGYVRTSCKAEHYQHGSYETLELGGENYMIGVAYHGRWFIKKLEQGVPDGDIEPFLSTDNRLHLPDLVAEAWQV